MPVGGVTLADLFPLTLCGLKPVVEGGAYLGGGPVPGLKGSFETDDIQFRVKHYVGGAAIATETMAVSKGDSSAWS